MAGAALPKATLSPAYTVPCPHHSLSMLGSLPPV